MRRREALAGAGAAIALLPVAALAAESVSLSDFSTDPGLAALKAGYERWRTLGIKVDDLYWAEDDAFARAREAHDAAYPAPPKAPELAVFDKMKVCEIEDILDPAHPATMPADLVETYKEWDARWSAWLKSRPPMSGPDADEYRRLGDLRERLIDERHDLRDQIFAIPTRSPRGLLLKIAVGVGADDLGEGLADAMEGNEPDREMAPSIVADLRAMVGETA